MKNMGRRIRLARGAKGWSQAKLAKAVGTSRVAIVNWESGENLPRHQNVTAVSKALGVTTNWLMTGLGPGPAIGKLPMDSERSDREHDRQSNDKPGAGDEQPGIELVGELGVSPAAGGGTVVDDEDEIAKWGFPAGWSRSELKAKAPELRIVTAKGDSDHSIPAQPDDIQSGDKIIVNTGDRVPSPPGRFVVYDGLGLVVKTVEYQANSDPPVIKLSSRNARYEAYQRTLDEVNIVGRVVGRIQRLG